MNATIENSLKKPFNDSLFSIFKQFNRILEVINESTDETTLRENMKELHEDLMKRKEDIYFTWGFGGNHMWVHQDGVKDRLLFVQL